jgi:excisionase family DNA binding protein
MYPNIDAERARNGLTIEELSKRIGVTRKTYYNWVKNGNIPQSKLKSLAELFGVSADYLLSHTAHAGNENRTGEM